MIDVLQQINNFLCPVSGTISGNQWVTFQFLVGISLFFATLAQRIYIPMYKSTSDYSWIIRKTGQVGIFMQSIGGVIIAVDAFQDFNVYFCPVDVNLTFLAFASILIKARQLGIFYKMMKGDKNLELDRLTQL